MSIATAPCSWPVSYAECHTLPDGWKPAEGEPASVEREQYERMAAEFLWRWTGRSLGVCETTIRPCRETCCGERPSTFEGRGPHPSGRTPWTPVLIGGEWFNVSCWACGPDACGCRSPYALRLPGPVASITEVKIDGQVLDPSAYRLDSHRDLVRLDGEGWPTAQDHAQPDTAAGTWSVTYDRGVEVPIGGQVAAGLLAVELWKAACGDKGCALPQRVQTVTRQGVTVAMLDSFDDIDKGHTGIFLIDSWVASMTQTPRQSSVYSPDTKRGRRA